MVKKLEMGTTEACTKSLEENVKDLRNVKRKEQNKKINTSTKSLNHASIQGNIQGNDQATLHTKKNVVNALERDTWLGHVPILKKMAWLLTRMIKNVLDALRRDI
jgi:hypothetical protein